MSLCSNLGIAVIVGSQRWWARWVGWGLLLGDKAQLMGGVNAVGQGSAGLEGSRGELSCLVGSMAGRPAPFCLQPWAVWVNRASL